MTEFKVVILAAGMGTRLGRPYPKPLTKLASGKSILEQQVDNLTEAFGDRARIMCVVGFKLELIMEAMPDLVFVYNENFDQTNTSKSLLKALRLSGGGGVLWMNGDVVFDPRILLHVQHLMEGERSFVCVNTSTVAEEEVKYTVDSVGYIDSLSKQVSEALGEAVGINYVSGPDKPLLIAALDSCDEQDYFERGLELAISEMKMRVLPVDISQFMAMEVDNQEDLDSANALLK